MTPIDYLLLAGAIVAGGYVIARLLVGGLRSSAGPAPIARGDEPEARLTPDRVEKAGAPWHFRK